MNYSTRDFSIPCLLSKKDVELLKKQFAERRDVDVTTLSDSVRSVSSDNSPSSCKKGCTVLSLSSDELVRDSRFRQNIVNSSEAQCAALTVGKSVHVVRTEFIGDNEDKSATVVTSNSTERKTVYYSNPRNTIIPPLRIKRTRKGDGTFNYHIHRVEEPMSITRLDDYMSASSGDEPIIIDLTGDDRSEKVSSEDSTTSFSLEWMDDQTSGSESPELSATGSNTPEITLIDAPDEELPKEEEPLQQFVSPTRAAKRQRSESDRIAQNVMKNPAYYIQSGCPYHKMLPLRKNGLRLKDPSYLNSHIYNIPNGINGDQVIPGICPLVPPTSQSTKNITRTKGSELFQLSQDPVNCLTSSKSTTSFKSNSEEVSQLEPAPTKKNPTNETALASQRVVPPGRIQRKRPLSTRSNNWNILARNRTSRGVPSPEEYKVVLLKWEESLNKQRRKTDAAIYVENAVDTTPPPLSFNYITQSIYSDGVPLPDSTALVGCNCVSCSEYSNCCAHMAGQRFAYYRNGRIRVGFGTPIYECNSMCRCDKTCMNRVVQKGSQFPLCIFRTKNGRGWGVKTCSPIKKGTFVTEYVGELITFEEAERRGQQYDKEGTTYLFDLDFNDSAEFTIDAAHSGNVSHFLNHSCDPNLVVFSVWIDTLDPRLPRLALFARRDIEKEEELTFDYQMNNNMSKVESDKRTRCLCGAKKCRGFLF